MGTNASRSKNGACCRGTPRLWIFALHSAVVLVLLTAGTAVAQPVQAKHAQVELLSRQSAFTPGRNLLLGVHFVLENGWHIYWINPGDSGQPPVFKWQLPPGFTAGEIQWPRPQRLQSSSQVVDYGYHDEVLLAVPVRVSPTASTSAAAQITLDTKWLICREVCLPDHAQLHLSLPLAASAPSQNAAAATLFAAAAQRMPKPLPATWRTRFNARKDDLILVVETGKPITSGEFFPLDPDQIENASPQRLEPTPAGARITLKKSDLLTKEITRLRGVLVLASGNAYLVEAPVTRP